MMRYREANQDLDFAEMLNDIGIQGLVVTFATLAEDVFGRSQDHCFIIFPSYLRGQRLCLNWGEELEIELFHPRVVNELTPRVSLVVAMVLVFAPYYCELCGIDLTCRRNDIVVMTGLNVQMDIVVF